MVRLSGPSGHQKTISSHMTSEESRLSSDLRGVAAQSDYVPPAEAPQVCSGEVGRTNHRRPFVGAAPSANKRSAAVIMRSPTEADRESR